MGEQTYNKFARIIERLIDVWKDVCAARSIYKFIYTTLAKKLQYAVYQGKFLYQRRVLAHWPVGMIV